jgi:hypothetical protein
LLQALQHSLSGPGQMWEEAPTLTQWQVCGTDRCAMARSMRSTRYLRQVVSASGAESRMGDSRSSSDGDSGEDVQCGQAEVTGNVERSGEVAIGILRPDGSKREQGDDRTLLAAVRAGLSDMICASRAQLELHERPGPDPASPKAVETTAEHKHGLGHGTCALPASLWAQPCRICAAH